MRDVDLLPFQAYAFRERAALSGLVASIEIKDEHSMLPLDTWCGSMVKPHKLQ